MKQNGRNHLPVKLARLFLLAAALLLSACETFHYGDKIRLRGAEVALLNWDARDAQKDMPVKERVTAIRNTVLYRLDGKLYERATLAYAPITHVAAWHRWLYFDGVAVFDFSSEETVGEPTERREIMVQVHPAVKNGTSPYIPADEFDFARAAAVKVSELEGDERMNARTSLYLYPRRVPEYGQPDCLRDYMADLPARKVHPLNYIAGGIVHLAVDWPLNLIVNIINPLDVWHFPESWR